MAGRFAGAPDLDAFWQLLTARGDAIRPVPEDRWDASAQLDPEKSVQAVGGFLDGVDLFDPTFFGISPREAEEMDPQHRLVLEESWRALEDAGRPAADLRGTRTGVYLGATWHDYELLGRERGARTNQHSTPGNALDMAATRVSYFLGLRGPSLTLETGCSSGLVALHTAAQALRHGEVEGALVGAVNLMLVPHTTIGLTHFGGLSPTGRCHTFSAEADGFVRGEGVVMLYLKTLSRALADGDRVHGVIVRTVVNNDGGGESLVTPHPAGQEALLAEAYPDDGIPLDRLVYVETHGTGTRRGDPVEAGAIGRMVGRRRGAAVEPLGIGSVKTNIGHLEPAAGLAGLVKGLLSLKHGVVPPSLHSEPLNPDIPFEELGLRVVREPLPLPTDGPVYIGVNSFGWGGTNAHAVLTAGPAGPTAAIASDAPGAPVLLPLSAQREDALRQRAADLARLLDDGPAAPGPDELAGTLAHHRDHFRVRAAFVGSSAQDLASGLRSYTADPSVRHPDIVTGRARTPGRIAFVFPGQGSQWAGMGRDLYATSDVFASVVHRCAKALEPHWDGDLTAIVSGQADDDGWLSRIDMVQPVLWAVSLGLAELWREAGAIPDVVVGHSQGEVTAATLAGILSYEDAALVMARRSAIAARTAGHGRMLAVDLGVEDATRALAGFEGRVSLAVNNGPTSCVLSGDTDAVLEIRDRLEAEGTFCRLVNVDYASHSPQMDGLREDLLAALRPVRPGEAALPLMSTVRVGTLAGPEMDAAYWADNLRRPVLFADAMNVLFDDGVTHVVEISPHPVLVPAVEQLAAARPEPPAVTGTLRRDAGTAADLARALARGYVQGLAPFGTLPTEGTVAVPGYPWQRERHWVAAGSRRTGASSGLAFSLTPSPGVPDTWQGTFELSLDDHPWLRDHQVHDAVILPGAAMMSFVLHAARARTGTLPGALDRVRFRTDLTLTDTDEPTRVSVLWRDSSPDSGSLSLLSLPSGAAEWTEHATAQTGRPRTDPAPPPFPERLAASPPGDTEDFYAVWAARGLAYGPAFQGLRALHTDGRGTLGRVRLPEHCRAGAGLFVLHPALWDAALQVALAIGDDDERAVVLAGAERVVLHAPLTEPVLDLWSHATRDDEGRLDLVLYDAERQPLLTVVGLEMHPLEATGAAGTTASGSERVLRMRFHEAERPAASQAGRPGFGQADTGAAGRWAVCASDGAEAAGQQLAAALESVGAESALMPVLDDETAWAQRLGEPGTPDAVVFVAPPATAGLAEQRRSVEVLTGLVRATLTLTPPPRLAVVTANAQAVVADDRPDPGAALFWGYTRALRQEHPELRPLLLDTDPGHDDAEWAGQAAAELLSDDGEDQVALRGARRYLARLERGAEAVAEAEALSAATAIAWQGPKQPFRLASARPGQGKGLRWLPLERRAPGPDEVEVEVTAAALNSIDVLTPLGTRPDASAAAAPLGVECAGRVTSVGAGVTEVRPGDRVVACAPGALATHVTVRADHTRPVPAGLADRDAAALPLATATAWYSLTEVARPAEGETVLIHSAADGPGLTALRVARLLGAEPIATAGSEAERAQLRELGVTHVFDSRDPSWAEQVMTATGGRGVDVVLNSLGGPAAALGLSVLADDGRFVEVGGQDIHAGPAVGRYPLRKGVVIATVDLPGLMLRRPERFARLLAAGWQQVESGELEPLPVTARPFQDAAGALRDMAEDGHSGTFVLVGPDTVGEVAPEPMPDGCFRANGTYVISGGLGALGLSLAEFLAGHGAGALALLGRSAPDEEALRRVAALRARGARVVVERLDVTDGAAVDRVLTALRAELPPLRGVFHTAGLLDDATVLGLRPEQLRRVLAPKVDGARNLDRATEGDPLDLFVLFSSAAGLVGNPGQAAYAAANTFLDGFAAARRRRGRPALSVQWGPFEDIGLAAARADRGDRLEQRGMGGFGADDAWQALVGFLHGDEPVVGYVGLDQERWFSAYPETAKLPSWERLRQQAPGSRDAGAGTGFLADLAGHSPHEWPALVEVRVRQLAGGVLQLNPDAMDPDGTFKASGLDSLMSLELRNRLEADFRLKLSPTLLWTHPTPRALAVALTERLAEAARAEDAPPTDR